MRGKLVIALAAVAVMLALPAGSAATPPLDVAITVDNVYLDSVHAVGTFTVDGPGTALLCPTGGVVDLGGHGNGVNQRFFTAHVVKLFTCDDGSGSFTIDDQVKGSGPGSTGNWTILSGTDAYASLHGVGRLIGTTTSPTSGIDDYTGRIHIN